jgi:hypothetical protein
LLLGYAVRLLFHRRTVCSVALAAFVFSCAALAQESSSRQEFWPEVDLYVNLNKKSRLFFTYSATREDDLKTYADGLVGAHIDFYMLPLLRFKLREHPDASRDKLLMFRIGYLFTRTPSDTSGPNEHTIKLETDARFPLPWDLLLTDRNRGDLQFVNGMFKPRYRNRLQIERSFLVRHVDLRPYGNAEVFYDLQYDKFNRFRYEAGMEVSLSRYLVIDGYYVRQNDTTSSPRFVNALGLKIQIYVR